MGRETSGQVLQQRSSSNASIDILNDDVLDRVFQYLYFDDKIRLRRTCSRWKYLLDAQLNKIKALRLGHFIQGGFCVTSGLSFPTRCSHQSAARRLHTGALFGENFLEFPAELETQCFSVNRYDYLHRALKYCNSGITTLSLGQLNITYRLLMVVAHNLPNLEHLEIINCASRLDIGGGRKRIASRLANNCTASNRENFTPQQQHQSPEIPSLETFNSAEQQHDVYKHMVLYNQHSDEQQNMQERLLRSNLLRNCDLVRESRRHTYWPHLRHLLVKECNLLNEFCLCLILAITNKTLTHLVVESSQYLTGEFLNYCGPDLIQLRLNRCPMVRTKFLDDLVKLKQFLAPANQKAFECITCNNPHASLITRGHD